MGTIKRVVTGILVLVTILSLSSALAKNIFNRKVTAEVEELFSQVDHSGNVVTKADIAELPQIVQNWLEYSGMIGKEEIATVHLKQLAYMKLAPDKSWLTVKAEQFFTSKKPGFIWQASNIKAAPLIHLSERDKYTNGKGNMLIKILSLFTVADSSGEEIDQGTMLRYLAETMWFPSAALNDYITWEEIDQHNAQATMTYGGVTASGIFTFNDKGEIIRFQAKRYEVFDGETRLETWTIPVSGYKEFEGIKIPTKGDVTWELATGDFRCFNFVVFDVEYN